MLAAAFRVAVSVQDMRARFPTSSRGLSFADLQTFASAVGLTVRGLGVSAGDLGTLCLPAILHWQKTHFVVLTEVSADGAVIHDPAFGRRALDPRELAEAYSGAALEVTAVDPSAVGVAAAGRSPAPRVPVAHLALGALAGLSLGLLAQLAVAGLVAVASGSTPPPGPWFAATVLVAIGYGAFESLRRRDQHRAELGMAKRRLEVFRGMATWPKALCDAPRLSSGEAAASHATADRARQSEAALCGALAVSGGLGLAISSDVPLAVCAVIGALVAASGNVRLCARLRARNRDVAACRVEEALLREDTLDRHLSTRLEQPLAALDLRWRDLAARAVAAERRASDAELLGQVVLGITGLAMAMVMASGVGLPHVRADAATALPAMIVGAELLLFGLCGLAGRVTARPTPGRSQRDLGDEHGSDPAAPDTTPTQGDPPARLTVTALAFTYGGTRLDLGPLDLVVQAGEEVVIEAPSAAGKTTLARLLAGIYQPIRGGVSYGTGRDGDTSKAWLVDPDVAPSGGNFARNIISSRNDLDVSRMFAAARVTGLHDFVWALPMRYRSIVTPGGLNLPAAQRRLLLLTRALYRRPAILILDDPLVSLDPSQRIRVAEAIESLGCTRIILTGEGAIWRKADRILKLRDGRLESAAPPWTRDLKSSGRNCRDGGVVYDGE
jgi:ATP-binding cassette subfamily B protein RaxB